MSDDYWFDPEFPDELPPESEVPEGEREDVDDE